MNMNFLLPDRYEGLNETVNCPLCQGHFELV